MADPHSILKKVFGYDSFRPGQEDIVRIPVISHPTGNPQRTGNITGPIAKSNSLHSPRKPIMLPYQILSHLRTFPILNIMLFPDSPAFLILLSNLLTCLRILQKRSVLLSLKIKYTQQQPSLTATVPAT